MCKRNAKCLCQCGKLQKIYTNMYSKKKDVSDLTLIYIKYKALPADITDIKSFRPTGRTTCLRKPQAYFVLYCMEVIVHIP